MWYVWWYEPYWGLCKYRHTRFPGATVLLLKSLGKDVRGVKRIA